MPLPTNVDASYADTGSASAQTHQQHHDVIHGVVNTLEEKVVPVLPMVRPEVLSKYAHVARDHGSVQAAVADTSGATLAALETEVNKLKAALRAVGIILP